MAEIRWSRDVERATFRLSVRDRADLFAALEGLRSFPEMGQPIHEGRYRGARRIIIGRRWLLYYRVIGQERACRLIALLDGRRRPR
jgi:plasmid stabilization system protein ParE